jgi:hypothetical protein
MSFGIYLAYNAEPSSLYAQIYKNQLRLVSQDMCTSGSYSSVPGECESYYACLWGKFEKFHCAPGLHFNPESQICDWPVRARCQDNHDADIDETPLDPVNQDTSGQRPTTKVPPTQATTTLPPAEINPDKLSPLSGYFKVWELFIHPTLNISLFVWAIISNECLLFLPLPFRLFAISLIGPGTDVELVAIFLNT